jgi:hypothetical protein
MERLNITTNGHMKPNNKSARTKPFLKNFSYLCQEQKLKDDGIGNGQESKTILFY